MYPLTKIKIDYIEQRSKGLSRSRAYQAASGNPNLRSCEILGSRLERNDSRIVEAIREILEALREANLNRRMVIHQEELDRNRRLDDLREKDRVLEALNEKLIAKPIELPRGNKSPSDWNYNLDASGHPLNDPAGKRKLRMPFKAKIPGYTFD